MMDDRDIANVILAFIYLLAGWKLIDLIFELGFWVYYHV